MDCKDRICSIFCAKMGLMQGIAVRNSSSWEGGAAIQFWSSVVNTSRHTRITISAVFCKSTLVTTLNCRSGTLDTARPRKKFSFCWCCLSFNGGWVKLWVLPIIRMSLNCWERREKTLSKGVNSVPTADTSYITTAVSSSITMCGRVCPAPQLLYRQVTPYLYH